MAGLKEVALLSIALALAPSCAHHDINNGRNHPPKTKTTERVEESRLALQKVLTEEHPDHPPAYEAEKQEVPVLKVVDGDTVDVYYKGKKERIRIIGINTPETVHPSKPVECFGREASNKMKELLEGQKIIIRTGQGSGDRGKYGRLLRYIELGGEDIGAKMIEEGYAFAYKKYPHERLEEYTKLERQARENGVGLWAEGVCDDFVPPPKPEWHPVPEKK
ncbi:thermonuclease family protein [Candidatus Peregrinibacteria bacterium]|jgi:micrococcal nuclease|nr:thermonuclease family protein [Candidatus Peregrinibacteria bacterium]MBT4147789.1 thermonuclease family protein [Candidatus Peregrinibacteria bacterium]MBT4366318.1 thermonuclease family protein [Candidatus Peregrinibacteria bacterium]MBT4456525.1 thermonuclease family protein [Candidatus Peregrinibacteria bacterium]